MGQTESGEQFKITIGVQKRAKGQDLCYSLLAYILLHPRQRFWQALRNWAEVNFIIVGETLDEGIHCKTDTFYWEGKNG